jgi:hypothetical protein
LERIKLTNLASIVSAATESARDQNTRIPQHERREKEEGEANMARFGGSESVIFKLVSGGSNVVR